MTGMSKREKSLANEAQIWSNISSGIFLPRYEMTMYFLNRDIILSEQFTMLKAIFPKSEEVHW